jgi:putative ABC transport system permease protein
VVVNDSLGARPGVGGLVSNEAFDAMAPGSTGQTYAVWIDPGVDRAATLAALEKAFPTTYIEHSAPRQVANLGLVSHQPAWLALIIGLLAGAALIHALVTSVRRGRRQLGILKTLGFTRGQVVRTVGWHASALAIAALIVGVPLGVITARVMWTRIVDNIGLVSAPVVSIPAIAAVAVLVLAVANLAALGPGLAAARTRPATALRTE